MSSPAADAAPAAGTDILTTICTQRRLDVAAARAAVSESVLHARVHELYPSPPLNLYHLLRSSPSHVIAAEFKRSSPSKGAIVPAHTPITPVITSYVQGGARILSVLTEGRWFSGSLQDLSSARGVVEPASPTPRPLLLRKDFVLEEYQVLEGRAHGADSVLLIVAALSGGELQALIRSARGCGMEPLVEVNSVGEMRLALDCGAKVLGINNRNLRTFTVDMGTTASIVAAVVVDAMRGSEGEEPPVILSLSGLKSPADVHGLMDDCTSASQAACAGLAVSPADVAACVRRTLKGFLVGEALMRAPSLEAATDMVRSLVVAGGGAVQPAGPARVSRAKVCGLTRLEDALHAAAAGASLCGIICVHGSPRYVPPAAAARVTAALRAYREQDAAPALAACVALPTLAERTRALMAAATRARPLTVGVFMNSPSEEVLSVAAASGLDCIQLHGDERPEDYVSLRNALPPIIKVIPCPATAPGEEVQPADVAVCAQRMREWASIATALLLDTTVGGPKRQQDAGGTKAESGGTGVIFNHASVLRQLPGAIGGADGEMEFPVMIAGGLTPDNVGSIMDTMQRVTAAAPVASHDVRVWVWAVDVSSGVEFDAACGQPKGVKDASKVTAFLQAVREAA